MSSKISLLPEVTSPLTSDVVAVVSGGASKKLTIANLLAKLVYGTIAGTACQGNDARLSDARTPTAHATSHAPGGGDALATGATGATFCIGNDSRLSDARTPTSHASSHLALGSDPLMTYLATNTDTGNHNDWAPGVVHGTTFLPWAGAADATFTGLAGGQKGDLLIFKNIGTKVAYFPHLSGSSSGVNQFTNSITVGNGTPVAKGGNIIFVHDGSTWQLVGHEQGAWVNVTFAAGEFTANGAQTWTVASAATQKFYVKGNSMKFALAVFGTTVGGTPNTQLIKSLPNGFTVNGDFRNLFPGTDNGTVISGLARATSGSMIFFRDAGTATNWAASTTNTNVQGTWEFEIN
jgi:hypothetical protein